MAANAEALTPPVPPSRCDLLVIGGGINGLGIAADAAARGLSVLLVEKEDFGGGTTAASSRLIHGGLRYLRYGELALVRESLRERGLLVRGRPHLVRPIQLLLPAYRGAPPPGWVVGIGLALYDLLARDPAFPRARRLAGADAVRRREPGLAAGGLTGGFLYPDAQLEFPERLCAELLRELRAAGGHALNHTRVVGLARRGDRVTGARLHDTLSGAEAEIEAELVLNAAGPWVDVVNRLLPETARPPLPRLIGGTRGTHLVLPRRPDGPRGPLYAAARKDGRPFFLLPWDGRLLVGTTDVPFEGDPDTLRSEPWEVEYLLAETNHLFPGCAYAESDVQHVTVGVRPLPYSERPAGARSRRHFLIDHGARHGVPGLASVVGGKLTTFRRLAEEGVDWVLRTLGRPPAPCPTRGVAPVPPPEETRARLQTRARELGLAEPVADRLARLYGPAADAVLEYARRDPALGAPLRPGLPIPRAEVLHAVQVEQARTADDVARRRLALLPASEADLDAVRAVAGEHGLALP